MFDVTASKTNTRALTNKKITNTQNKRTSTPKRKQTSASIQITNSKSKQLFTTLSRLAKKRKQDRERYLPQRFMHDLRCLKYTVVKNLAYVPYTSFKDTTFRVFTRWTKLQDHRR